MYQHKKKKTDLTGEGTTYLNSTDRSVPLITALPDFIIKSITDILALLMTRATWAIHSLFQGQR